ncbi:OmpW family protein [Bacteriovorax sp. DB6_IX]|uniref:OmpW/AlkL family protein n=1 Tax=Bacteriovorax sp. DB6_IX TaxID=1353530 RepID=UPI00038A1BC6|nr:OmpW family outer membrane protein [Bacteriovorax sp. DB6_IX]EQC50511.1 OmpW family protein [Bacteriovorax sp. DB6_IX]
MKKLLCLAMTAASLFASAPSALAAEDGNMMIRVRAIQVMPDEEGTPSAIGGEVQLNNESVPEIDISYFVNKNFAFELILATATHEASAYNTSLNTLDLGDVSLLPPTLLAQYHHEMGNFKPYVGAGLNYTIFYGEEPQGVVKNITYDNSLGYALQVGADYKIGDNIYFNVDVKKLFLSTDVEVETFSNGTVTAEVDINPYIIGLGVGFRF